MLANLGLAHNPQRKREGHQPPRAGHPAARHPYPRTIQPARGLQNKVSDILFHTPLGVPTSYWRRQYVHAVWDNTPTHRAAKVHVPCPVNCQGADCPVGQLPGGQTPCALVQSIARGPAIVPHCTRTWWLRRHVFNASVQAAACGA